MTASATEKRSFSLPLRCTYLLRAPERPGPDSLLVVTLHGHAMTPEEMLRLSAPLVGDEHFIAALQGPHQLWINAEGNARSRVAFHWGTSHEPESSRRMHHDMILHLLDDVGLPAARSVLLGFSQSVSYNYRFVCTHPEAVRGVIGICGGLPGDWEEASYQTARAAALHIATREDQFYPPPVTELYPERLRRRVADVEFHLLEGGHRIPSAARPPVRAWLERLRHV